ncbi:hypothetical protein JCM16303_004083 [Sporobolomyces ruberrimus]
MVRAVSFEVFVDRAYIGALNPTDLVTTQLNTLSTFLGIATGVEKIRLGRGWKDSDHKIERLIFRERLHSLSLSTASAWTFSRINEHLPNLKCLEIDEFVKGGWRQSTFAGAKSIDTIISRAAGTVIFTLWILASSATLRTLKVTAAIACDLDFSSFPEPFDLESALVPLDEAREVSAKFWSSIDEIPSLSTLSFEGSRLSGPFEEAFFGVVNRFLIKEPHLVETLRTLRFGEGFPLERFYSLVDWPMSKGIRRIVVPASMKSPEAKSEEKEKFRAVAEFSEALGLEVFLAESI